MMHEAGRPSGDSSGPLDDASLIADAEKASESWPVEMRKVLEAERHQRLVAEELHAVAQRITAELSLDEALAAVLRSAERMFGATSASILLAEHSEILPNRRFTTRNTGEPHWDNRGQTRPRGLTQTVLSTGRPVVVDEEPTNGPTRTPENSRDRTRAAIPIRHGERIVGVLFVDWDGHRICTPSDLRLLETLAAYGAIAIENARLRARDQSARLETEQARLRLQQFVGMVAHDLRGPLGVIATSLELLRENRRRNRAGIEQHVLPATENAIRRMRRLVDDLLGASRIGSGRFQIRPFPMDLVDVARRVVEQHRSTSELHQLVLDAPEKLEGEWDPERIGQLLTNLISNAVKYSPDGGEVRITISRTDDEVTICVTDHGVGISKDQVRLLFEPFIRLDREPETEGLGLGLYIAKAIAEAHGGRIWVDSDVGRGASFFVAFPLVDEASQRIVPPEAASASSN